MRSIEILNILDETHGLKNLVNKSLIAWNVLWYRDVYMEFDAFIKMGAGTSEAVRLTSVKLNVSESVVYVAKRKMESE